MATSSEENKKPTYRKASSGHVNSGHDKKDSTAKSSSNVLNEGRKAQKDAKQSEDPKKDLEKNVSKHHSSSSEVEEKKSDAKEEGKSSTKVEHGKHAAHAKDAKAKNPKEGEHNKKDAESSSEDGKKDDHKPKPDERIPSMPKKKSPVGPIIGGLVAAVVIVVCVFFGINSQSGGVASIDKDTLQYNNTVYNEAGELLNPIDWETWKARNSDVYAWLQIEGTNVDYPILQHPLVDDYYLMRNIDGVPEINGTLYTQVGYNSKALDEDPVTIIYGHTFESLDTMFTTLHNFENADFFNANPTFYVYTPDERFEYEIVSAFEYDNRHILETQDMSDDAVRAAFFSMVQNPSSINKNVRELESELNPDEDNLLILSTCTQPANDNARYLVVAVLKDVKNTEDAGLSGYNGIIESRTLSEEELDALPDVE